VIGKPAGLLSRTRLCRVWNHRNWDMLFVALQRQPLRRCRPTRLCKEGSRVCDGQQRIVDQAKAQSNAWDTGVVPGHREMELNSTIAEEVKKHVLLRS
jgi:hypothetical protein